MPLDFQRSGLLPLKRGGRHSCKQLQQRVQVRQGVPDHGACRTARIRLVGLRRQRFTASQAISGLRNFWGARNSTVRCATRALNSKTPCGSRSVSTSSPPRQAVLPVAEPQRFSGAHVALDHIEPELNDAAFSANDHYRRKSSRLRILQRREY